MCVLAVWHTRVGEERLVVVVWAGCILYILFETLLVFV